MDRIIIHSESNLRANLNLCNGAAGQTNVPDVAIVDFVSASDAHCAFLAHCRGCVTHSPKYARKFRAPRPFNFSRTHIRSFIAPIIRGNARVRVRSLACNARMAKSDRDRRPSTRVDSARTASGKCAQARQVVSRERKLRGDKLIYERASAVSLFFFIMRPRSSYAYLLIVSFLHKSNIFISTWELSPPVGR